MQIQIETDAPFVTARLTGDLLGDEAERFIEDLDEHGSWGGAALAVDLSAVTSIDSRGLSALVHITTRANMTQDRVILLAPSAFVRGVLEVTRLGKWFELSETSEQVEKLFTAR